MLCNRVWGFWGLIRGEVLKPKVLETGHNAALLHGALKGYARFLLGPIRVAPAARPSVSHGQVPLVAGPTERRVAWCEP